MFVFSENVEIILGLLSCKNSPFLSDFTHLSVFYLRSSKDHLYMA